MAKNTQIKKKVVREENPRSFIDFFLRYYLFFLAAFVAAIYIVSLNSGLVYCDDHEIIINNFSRLRDIGNIPAELFRGYMNTDYYRPLINLSFIFDAQLGGREVFFFHLTNVAMHFVSCCLIYFLLLKFNFNKLSATAASLIFAVHPLATNAVSWIPGRNDIIFTIFLLSSFIFFLRYIENKQNRDLLFHVVLFTFAMLSKETSIVFPVILVLYLILIKRNRQPLKFYMPLVSGWVISVGLWVLGRHFASLGAPVNRTGFYLFDNIATIPELLGKFFLPFNLSVLPTFGYFNTIIGIIILAGIIIVVFRAKGINKPMIWFGLLWFVIGILPGLFIRNLDIHDWNEYLECRAYFPVIGLLVCLTEVFGKNLVLNKKNITIFSSITLLLVVLTIKQSLDYKDSRSFYTAAVKSNPNKARFHEILAKIYWKDGDLKLAENEFILAVRSNPKYGLNYYNLGSFYFKTSKYSSAAENFEKAKNLNYKTEYIYEPLALSYKDAGDNDKAINVLKEAIVNNPDSLVFKTYLLELYSLTARYSEFDSILNSFLKSGLTKKEASTIFNNIGENLLKESKDTAALRLIRRAAQIDDSNWLPEKNLFLYTLYIDKDTAKAKPHAKKVLALGGKLKPGELKAVDLKP